MAGIHGDLEFFLNRLIRVTPVDFVVLQGLRTVEQQRELVASGASTTMNSRHLTGHAVDLACWLQTIRWELDLYCQVADAARAVSLDSGIPIRWGGAWQRLDLTRVPAATLVEEYAAQRRAQGRRPFIDSGHFELPATVYG